MYGKSKRYIVTAIYIQLYYFSLPKYCVECYINLIWIKKVAQGMRNVKMEDVVLLENAFVQMSFGAVNVRKVELLTIYIKALSHNVNNCS